MRHLLSVILFTLLATHALKSQITSNVLVSKDTILIGDELDITLKLKLPMRYTDISLDCSPFDTLKNLIPQEGDNNPTIADIEWEGQNWITGPKTVGITLEEVEKNKTSRIWTETFPVRIWDIGLFQLPHPILLTNTGDTITGVYPLQSPTVLVLPPMGITPPDTTQIIADIKSIVAEEKNWRDYFVWYFAILLLLGIALLWYYLRKANMDSAIHKTVVEPEIFIPAHIKALDKLDQLRKDEQWKTGRIKEYQTRLTFIIREYLENRYDIQALESTTSEITNYLKRVDFDTSHEHTLKEILQIADLVKFAKATPPENIHEQFLQSAEDFVNYTKKEITEVDELDA